MNREALDKGCERGILGLVLAILIFGPLAMGAVDTPFFLVIQALTMAVMLLWALRLWLNPRMPVLWPPICWVVVAFTLYALGRYFTAELEYVARVEITRVLIYAFLFLAILNNLHRQEYTQLIVLTLIFLAMGISFYAFYQFASGSEKVWTLIKPYPRRGSGTFISPNNLAGFLEMILPLGLAWTLVSRAKALVRIFVGYASLVILVGIAVSVSRGGWASVGLVLLVLFGLLILHRTYRIPALVTLVILVGTGWYFIPRTDFFQARLKEITANAKFNDSARFDLWEPAVNLWQENIWWGIGPNHFDKRFRAYRPQLEQLQPDRVHNDYLNTLTDWGIVGAALVASALALLFLGMVRTWRFVRGTSVDLGGKNSNKFALVVGTSFGLLAILFHSVVDFNMHVPSNAILAITLMAILTSTLRFATDQYWFAARTGWKVVGTLVLLAGVTYLGWQGVRSARENTWLERASRAEGLSPAQITCLQKAFAIEPTNFETAYAIGNVLRLQNWDGGDEKLMLTAMEWFDRAMKLDPYHSSAWLEYGLCLDWLGQTEKSPLYLDHAARLDPNGYFTAAWIGWHYIKIGNYAAARDWLERSQRLEPHRNMIADSYLPIITQRMTEQTMPLLGQPKP
jgi:O-antigen ligase